MEETNLEEICMQLIAHSGMAKSLYLEALAQKKEGKAEEIQQLLDQGREAYIKAHDFHQQLMAFEGTFSSSLEQLLLMHAEDQMMAAENASILVNELLSLYDRLNAQG